MRTWLLVGRNSNPSSSQGVSSSAEPGFPREVAVICSDDVEDNFVVGATVKAAHDVVVAAAKRRANAEIFIVKEVGRSFLLCDKKMLCDRP